MRPPDAIVTHHTDGFRSGVARFNEILAGSLGVPLLDLPELERDGAELPLLSFKVSELDAVAEARLRAWLDGAERTWDVFLHAYAALPLERSLVAGARRVLCGNAEVAAAADIAARPHEVLWAPGIVSDSRVFQSAEVTVFSFGMAHKIRTDMFRRLERLLAATGVSYAVYASAANHETASLRDSDVVFAELHEIFPDTLFFLGNLSDVAVHNRLLESTFFAAFFEHGVRANNTSVAAALERGAVVITNLDAYSPPDLVHMHNVIDIGSCETLPLDPETLQALSDAARATAAQRSWAELTRRVAHW